MTPIDDYDWRHGKIEDKLDLLKSKVEDIIVEMDEIWKRMTDLE